MGRATSLILGAVLAVHVPTACADGDRSGTSSTTAPPTTIVEGAIAASQLATGDCLTDVVVGAREHLRVESVELVSCYGSHGLEVFTVFSFAADDFGTEDPQMFPGRARVVVVADAGCIERADLARVDRQQYGLLAFWPTRQSWALGDRAVACAIYDRSGEPFAVRQLG